MSTNTVAAPDTNNPPNWLNGHYSKANLDKILKQLFVDKLPEFNGNLAKSAFCLNQGYPYPDRKNQRYTNYFVVGSMTLKDLVESAKGACEREFGNDNRTMFMIKSEANDIIKAAGDKASKPLNFATDIKIVFPNGIKGTRPYKKPGFMGSDKLKGETNPSDMKGEPNWIEGYFSVAYLNALYKAYCKNVEKDKEHIEKNFNTEVIAGYDKTNYDNFVERLGNPRLCMDLKEQVTDFGENSCKEKYDRMKCTKVSQEIVNQAPGHFTPLEARLLPEYNTKNPPTPEKKRWWGGKRKQRRNKTNKIRTHNNIKNTKNTKNTKKKNKRAKHSRKAKKARKSRNARKTRKH